MASDQKNTSSYALNLLIIGVAIILVLIVYKNMAKMDPFVGRVPNVPIGGGPYFESYYGIPPGVFPKGQPEMYPYQYYPAKYPYINDTVEQVGRPCDEQGGCGVLGACQNGVCTIKQDTGETSVFDMKI